MDWEYGAGLGVGKTRRGGVCRCTGRFMREGEGRGNGDVQCV